MITFHATKPLDVSVWDKLIAYTNASLTMLPMRPKGQNKNEVCYCVSADGVQ